MVWNGAGLKVNPVTARSDVSTPATYPPMWNISTFRFRAVSSVRISE